MRPCSSGPGSCRSTPATQMKVLDRILEAAMEGKMSAERFSWLWRGRRSNGSYLGAVLAAARLSGHPQREIMICRSVTTRLNALP